MSKANNEIFDFISMHISKSDIYAAKILGKISAFICKKRTSLGMNQKEFAKHMDVTQSMISKWESADYNFSIESISKISEKLGCVIDITFKSESEYLANASQSEYNLPKLQNKFRIPNIADNGSKAA